MKAVRSILTTSYAAHNGQAPFYQSSYCQSCSGSETDVSTSTENLSAEERVALRRGERQEPQGEETAITEEELGSRSNTLVIRNNSSIDGFTSPFYGKAPETSPGKCVPLLPTAAARCEKSPRYPSTIWTSRKCSSTSPKKCTRILSAGARAPQEASPSPSLTTTSARL
ncbi:hypothetical protein MRX96_005630 [Rhipicephalus microplus]